MNQSVVSGHPSPSAVKVTIMNDDKKHSASTPASKALPHISDFVAISKADTHQKSFREEASGFDLIDKAAELIRVSEQRASQAEEKAERVSAKAIEAVKAAQVRFEQTQAHARLIEQHAAEQAKLAEERVTKAEALAQERIDEAHLWAEKAEERARAAESQLKDAEARATDAEERLEHLNHALRRKLSSAASMSRSGPVVHNVRSLN